MSTTRVNLTVSFAAWLLLGLLVGDAAPVGRAMAPFGGTGLWLQLIPAACLFWVRLDWLGRAVHRLAARRHRRERAARWIRV